ncbi:hypothetical protein AGMMS49574_18660 [Bacteroidia bacterium]|nr:hypothetical protein AGMMS49574_18660 [Bacteroidia bacterium]GHU59507.1 hypothetical protein FACS189411_16390 [Bacteroidia bacterium]
MDNLGDWLYIILLVVFGLSGLLSSLKKKVPAEVEQTQSYDEYELEEELPHKVEMPKKVPHKKPDYFSNAAAEGRRNVKTIETDFHHTAVTEEESPFHLSADTFHDMDELKKAIIYSEILNRKY